MQCVCAMAKIKKEKLINIGFMKKTLFKTHGCEFNMHSFTVAIRMSTFTMNIKFGFNFSLFNSSPHKMNFKHKFDKNTEKIISNTKHIRTLRLTFLKTTSVVSSVRGASVDYWILGSFFD